MNVVSEFGDNQGFSVKLTEDKIFISAVGNEETLALRGVNGVGVYDDIEKYNDELAIYKNKTMSPKKRKNTSIGTMVFGVLYAIWGISVGLKELAIVGAMFVLAGYIISKYKSKKQPPALDSYFRIMLTGGDRKFKFDKSGDNAKNIAQFINKVEETLTAYNKA